MKVVQSVCYYLAVLFISLALIALEYLCFNSIIEAFISSLALRIVIYMVLLIIVNPIISYFLASLIPLNIEGYKKEEIYAVHPEES